jgi:uncharacterized protein (DUF1800 family)
MLPLLLLLIAAQLPAVPGETSLVSSCKQGKLSACEALKQVDPQKAARIARDLARLKALEEARERAAADDAESATDASSEPPDCKGQNHHIISRPVAEELEKHDNLRGFFKPRDPRFVAKARDEQSHCGYQEWHRKVDAEVIRWLREHPEATVEEFVARLREIYNRPDMLERFPRGF